MPPPFRPDAVIVHPRVDAAYRALEAAADEGRKPQQGIWKRFQAALARIRAEGQWGEVIPSGDIPAYFQDTYGVHNLYCIDLAGDVRCFYTIEGHDVILLDIIDHDAYDDWFPPKGRRRRR